MKNKIIISENASELLVAYFEKNQFDVIRFQAMTKPYDAVSSHPDIFMFYDEKLFVDQEVTQYLGSDIVTCESITKKYPGDIKFNVCKLGHKMICKYDFISPELKSHFKQNKYEIINVNQGYAKCSTCIVDEKSIITSDKSIEKACRKNGIDVLLIDPGHIKLKGLEYGFIGGASVSFSDIVFFNGDISKHPNYEDIKAFVEKRNKKIECMNYDLEDLGSFIIIDKE